MLYRYKRYWQREYAPAQLDARRAPEFYGELRDHLIGLRKQPLGQGKAEPGPNQL
jgi:hypothetical protein